MRTVFGHTLYRITNWRAAGEALWSCADYQQHKDKFLPRRHAGRPGEKLLCHAHVIRMADELVRLTPALARESGTTLGALWKAYPSSWYVVSNDGVWVRFPAAIRYGNDLPEFEFDRVA